MNRSSIVLHTLLLLSTITACSRSEGKPSQSQPAAAAATATAPAAAVDPETVFEQSGDKLAASDAMVTWHDVVLALVERGDAVVIRSYGATGVSDVVTSVGLGDLTNRFEIVEGGAAVRFYSELRTGREEGVGLLVAHEYARIVWDDAKGAPVVRETWSCDETEAPQGICKTPAWAGGEPGASADPTPTATPAAAAPPSADDAARVMKDWLISIKDGDTSAAPALMADTFVITGNQELRGPMNCPESGQATATTLEQRRNAAECTYDVLSPHVASLAKKAVPASVRTTWPDDSGSWRDDSGSWPGSSEPEGAALLALGPAGSLAFVPVYRTSGGIEWGALGVVANVDGHARLVGVYVVAPLLGG